VEIQGEGCAQRAEFENTLLLQEKSTENLEKD